MDKTRLLGCLEALDRALGGPATLCIYGSAAGILLDEPGRTSLDLDVAGPYSTVSEPDLRRAADAAGLPVNPPEDYAGDHLEWVGPLRLCLAAPDPRTALTLWQGDRLRVICPALPDLIASKLIRYDRADRADVLYLAQRGAVRFPDIAAATDRLPNGFADDALVRENLVNVKADLESLRGREGA